MTNHTDSAPTIVASQLATVSASAERLDRARSYSARLDAHAAEIRAKLDILAGSDGAGSLRGELVEIDRQRRQASAALAAVEAEHMRHAADLAALHGSDGASRATLAEAHAGRARAHDISADAKAILDRATAHAEAVRGKLAAARAAEAHHDAEAADRLHAALRDGTEVPTTAEPLARTAAGLEDDHRAANAAEARAASEHRAKLAALADAEREVRAAADGVMLAEADAMAAEVQALDIRAALLRGRLAAYVARTPGDHVEVSPVMAPAKLTPGGWYTRDPASTAAPPRVRQTPAIAAVLPLNGASIAYGSDETASWAVYASALTRDAAAESDFTPIAPAHRALTLGELGGPPASSGPSIPARAA